MRFLWAITLIFFFSKTSYSQQLNFDKNYVKLSAGRVLFGTGDVIGFSINIEYSKNTIKQPKLFLSQLLIGGEFSFESGVKNPVVENPTAAEFMFASFTHISNNIFSAKITYYPFPRFFKGFNISVGPAIGYQFRSYEGRAQLETYSPTVIRRMSELRFANEIILGYRVTTGYEVQFSKRLAGGFRLDFSNYNNGDINTLVALKIGYKF